MPWCLILTSFVRPRTCPRQGAVAELAAKLGLVNLDFIPEHRDRSDSNGSNPQWCLAVGGGDPANIS